MADDHIKYTEGILNNYPELPLFYSNTLMAYIIETVQGDESFWPSNISELTYDNKIKFTDLINAKYLISMNYINSPDDSLVLVYDDEVKMYERTDVMPRAYIIYDYKIVAEKKLQKNNCLMANLIIKQAHLFQKLYHSLPVARTNIIHFLM